MKCYSVRDFNKTIPYVVLTATIKDYQIGLLADTLQLKQTRKIFTGKLDRPHLYYEAHKRKEGIWTNLDNLSVPVYKKLKNITGGPSKIKFTKVKTNIKQ